MKMFKMFGLAAFAALMAMAFVGAGSALAEETELCGHDGTSCEAIHHIHLESVGKTKLLTSFGTLECNLLLLGDITASGKPAKIKGNITYSSCELAGSECTAKEENGPAELEVLKESHETGTVTYKYLVHLVCGKSIDCSYTGTGLKGTVKGPLLSEQTPDNGEVSLTGQETTKEAGGFLCPKAAKLDITTSPLWPIYLTTTTTELLGYCVQTEHKTGLYTDAKCETLGNPLAAEEQKHEWTYALVLAKKDFTVGDAPCYGTLLPYGLWKNSTCESDDTGHTSLYEKGIIKFVE